MKVNSRSTYEEKNVFCHNSPLNIPSNFRCNLPVEINEAIITLLKI